MPYIMMQMLPLRISNVFPATDDGLAVITSALAGSLPRAITNAHLIAEINSADILATFRPIGAGWGGLDIGGDMLMHFELSSMDDHNPGFPDANASLQVTRSAQCFCFCHLSDLAGCHGISGTQKASHGPVEPQRFEFPS